MHPPISQAQALARFRACLTEDEAQEILEYSEVSFLGRRDKKLANYDTKEHMYRVVAGDHVAFRYEVLGELGKGSFGIVVRARDHAMQRTVALKIVVATEQMRHQGEVEMRFMKELAASKYVCHIYDTFTFRGHVCGVMELLGDDSLRCIDKMRKGFPIEKVRVFAHDLFAALADVHERDVIHADVKPENLMITRGRLKLTDFGSACKKDYTPFDYIASRYYRAPEICLHAGESGRWFGPEVDIWAAACALVELYTARPLFPAQNEAELIAMVANRLGPPPASFLERCQRKPQLRGRRPRQRAATALDPGLADLVEKCLQWEPGKRITAAQALEHPFVASVVPK